MSLLIDSFLVFHTNASGIPIPATPTGWTPLYSTDFDADFPIGGVSSAGVWPSTGGYSANLWSYSDGTPDTAGGSFGDAARYFPSTVLEVTGSKVVKHLSVVGGSAHSAVVGVSPGGVQGQLYGRYSICWRVPVSFNGWKAAWLLWPNSENWPTDGEIDFPEMPFDYYIAGYVHHQGGTSGADVDGFEPFSTLAVSTGLGSGWHVTTIEWAPGFCRFWLDNDIFGTVYGANVPNTAMHWILQTETDFSSYPTNMPASTDAGTVEIDWISMEAYSTFTAPGATQPSHTSTFTEAFTGTNGAVWDTGRWTSVTTTSGGSAQIQTNRGRLTTGTLGSYGDLVQRTASVTLASSFMAEFTARCTTTSEVYARAVFRATAGNGNDCYYVQYEPAAGLVHLQRNDAGVETILASYSLTYSVGLDISTEILCFGGDIQVRLWTTGSRPTVPQMFVYDKTKTGTIFGFTIIGGNAASAVSFEFDGVTVSSVP